MEWNQGNLVVAQGKDSGSRKRVVMMTVDESGRVREDSEGKMTGLDGLQCFHCLIPKTDQPATCHLQ